MLHLLHQKFYALGNLDLPEDTKAQFLYQALREIVPRELPPEAIRVMVEHIHQSFHSHLLPQTINDQIIKSASTRKIR